MPLALTLTIQGDQSLIHSFQEWDALAADLRVPFGTIAARLIATEGQRFDAEGPGWAPLSPAYAAWKAQHFPGKPILQRTGRLRRSLLGESDEYQRTITSDSLTVRSRVPYGGFHQSGTTKMPARPPLAVSPEEATAYALIIKRYLITGAQRIGFLMQAEAAG